MKPTDEELLKWVYHCRYDAKNRDCRGSNRFDEPIKSEFEEFHRKYRLWIFSDESNETFARLWDLE